MNKLFSALIFSAIAAFSLNAYAAAPDAGKPVAAKTAEAAKPAEKLDINTATEQQLRDFPGIGEARAAAIIKGRPYKTKDELTKKKIIPQAVYNKIKDNIIAKQAK